MEKKTLNDLSDLKHLFSTNPKEIQNHEEEKKPEKNGQIINKTPIEKQELRIDLDKKHRGGKEVTLISGFDMEEDDLTVLAKQLKSKCGVGGSVTEYKEILLQGDHRKKLPDILKKIGFKKIRVIGL